MTTFCYRFNVCRVHEFRPRFFCIVTHFSNLFGECSLSVTLKISYRSLVVCKSSGNSLVENVCIFLCMRKLRDVPHLEILQPYFKCLKLDVRLLRLPGTIFRLFIFN